MLAAEPMEPKITEREAEWEGSEASLRMENI
jgi:hypothetical protein